MRPPKNDEAPNEGGQGGGSGKPSGKAESRKKPTPAAAEKKEPLPQGDGVNHKAIAALKAAKLRADPALTAVVDSFSGKMALAGEITLSRMFAERYAHRFRFVPEFRQWIAWDGKRWKLDAEGAAKFAAKELCDEYAEQVRVGCPPGTKPKARAQLARPFESAHIVAAVLDLANCEPAMVVLAERLDADNLLLNTPKGTIDLRTGVMRPHCSGDFITKITTISPDDSPRPVFDKFLREVTCGDDALAEYLQISLGACLSGALTDHWLLFWYGQGRNGKNTLGDLVLKIMGDYAKVIPTQTLMSDRHGNRHPTEIANLRGFRLAISSEVSEGEYWDEAKIKSLTGDAMMSGRFMRSDFIEFRRTHKHTIYGNHRPMLRIVDKAMAERLHLVPFNATFTAALGNVDTEMPMKLSVEAGGVMRWLIEGHAKWRKAETLLRCDAVKLATDDYFAQQSTLDTWIAERCNVVPDDGRNADKWTKAGKLYKDYADWKTNRGEYPTSLTRWAEQMGSRFVKKMPKGIAYYVGLELIWN
jgi:putative DNA primase/helicase